MLLGRPRSTTSLGHALSQVKGAWHAALIVGAILGSAGAAAMIVAFTVLKLLRDDGRTDWGF
jgi:hypothetical protein